LRRGGLEDFVMKIFVDRLAGIAYGRFHVATQQPLPHRRNEPSRDG